MISINRFIELTSTILIALTFSCNPKTKIDHNPKIRISYYKGFIETVIAVKCGQVSKIPPMEFKVDTVINDTNVIFKIIQCASHLLPKSDSRCEGRLDCFIILNADTTKICIGDFDCIRKDGNSMERNDTLLYLIRKNSGYYNYFKKDDLKYFDEIKIFEPALK